MSCNASNLQLVTVPVSPEFVLLQLLLPGHLCTLPVHTHMQFKATWLGGIVSIVLSLHCACTQFTNSCR